MSPLTTLNDAAALSARYLSIQADGATNRQRVVCQLTKHELPLNLAEVNRYLTTKSYAAAVKLAETIAANQAHLKEEAE